MAMTNTVANINGFLAPFVIGEIVTTAVFPIINFPSQFVLVKLIHYFRLFQGSLSQWQIVFFLTAGVYTINNLFYLVFGTGEEQPWNQPKSTKHVE